MNAAIQHIWPSLKLQSGSLKLKDQRKTTYCKSIKTHPLQTQIAVFTVCKTAVFNQLKGLLQRCDHLFIIQDILQIDCK